MSQPLEKQKILIVDDELINRQLLSEIFRDNLHVILAKNGKQALEKSRAHIPDLILLDLLMPGPSGYEVLQQLKSNPQTKNIAVIIVSGLGSSVEEARGLELGALDYIIKPFVPAIVKARVENLLNLVKHQREIEKLASLDGLTGIANRRKFDETLELQWRYAFRNNTPIGLAMIDVDHFKPFNDNYGHALGDTVLQEIAKSLNSNIRRPLDMVARYGGEEFCMILPDVDLDGAKHLSNLILEDIRGLNIRHKFTTEAGIVTVSIGGSIMTPIDDKTPVDLIQFADRQLYSAKEKGRNQSLWTMN